MEYGQIRPLQVIEIREVNGRGERIRTSGPCLPKAVIDQKQSRKFNKTTRCLHAN